MRRVTLAAAVVLLFAGSAVGQTWTKEAAGAGGSCGPLITPGVICYMSYTGATADSNVFYVTRYADCCLDPAIRKCVYGTKSANSCERVVVDNNGDGQPDDGVLDGDSAQASSTQKACIYDLGPGLYYIETATDPGAETAVVMVAGHQ